MLRLVHHPAYVWPIDDGGAFPWNKYGLLKQALETWGGPLEVHAPEPMPRAWIEAVHDPAYVAEVIAAQVPREKERRIGFPVTDRIAERAQIVPGGTWLAAQLALRHGFAANGAGGSHHALADTGAGYCVFNDLAIVANRLATDGDVERLLIVDCDVHQGDGTAALLAGRSGIATFMPRRTSLFARSARPSTSRWRTAPMTTHISPRWRPACRGWSTPSGRI